jgi:lipase ATG15
MSSCWNAGYAMETQCHTGLECVYDTVNDLGWRVHIANHRQGAMINDVLLSKKYASKLGVGKVIECKVVPSDCVDCYGWSDIGGGDPGKGF